ncbi:MAG: DNA repair protein RecN [Candidatus Aminicenantes bacterium]|nr:DNA repair protein RecN [Candidatus Aminicenantes bacterium]
MLRYLRIKNLATIEDLELELEPGFITLTGETGAGKSIIIDALKLLLGEKASLDLIRTGKEEASVEAVFAVEGARGILQDLGMEAENELLVQRIISAGGVSKSYLNGLLVPLKKLKEIGEQLVDIYGQNDHIFLLDTSNHLRFLDSFAETQELRERVKQQAQIVRARLREKNELENRKKERLQRLDFIEFQIKEIETAELKPGEEEELLQERSILKNAEKIALVVNQVIDLTYESEESLIAVLKRVQALMAELSSYFPELESPVTEVNEFAIYLKELVNNLMDLRDKYAPSPERLEEIEARLSLLEKLKRKYGSSMEELLIYLNKIKAEKEELEKSEEKLAELDKEIAQEFELYLKLSSELSTRRREKARLLEKMLEKELAQLAMPKVRLAAEFRLLSPSLEEASSIRENGLEEVEFLFSPNPGEELRPLRKIASGGELSRLMLAFKALGKEKDTGKTLIFDEIDAGIGGQTATSVARKLQQLSRYHQVLCITHLPQIASCASTHIRVEKKTEKDRTYTTVKKLKDKERTEEIARLISGTRLTEASLQMARELLQQNSSAK